MLEKNSLSQSFLIKNLEVVCYSKDEQRHPSCPHGPTILFRANKNGEYEEYYACSAFRNRKGCNFYMNKDDWNESKLFKKVKSCVDVERIKNIRNNIFNLDKKGLSYCHQCNEIFHKFFNAELHQEHKALNISPNLFEAPTKFLQPLNNDKAEAQYFFRDDTLNFFGTMLKKLKFSKVICIGVPRLHEHLKKWYDILGIQSILLDLDHRFFYFNSESEFFYYNMFNNYFFEGQEKEKLFHSFLQISENESILIITDPPFGCRTEPLALVLREISNNFRKINNFFRILPIIWVFPYYMEHYIKKEMPEMEMLDFKVNYTNHDTYHDGVNARKYGSPVRFFTNIPLNIIELPESDGYRKCVVCEKWTAFENVHCDICNICPSRNGERYRHCNLCEMCVKPNYIHCKSCRRCTQKENHNCTVFEKKAPCWICKKTGHLEVSCDKNKENLRRKIVRYKERKKRVCVICFKNGHNESNCKKI